MARPSPRMRLTSPAPSTPIASRGTSPLPSGSPVASSPSTPSRAGVPGENTYQRTCRAILKNVSVIDGNWVTLSSKLDDSLARVQRLKEAANDKAIISSPDVRLSKIRKQAKALEEEQIYLLQQFEKMAIQVDQLRKNSQKAEELLLEMSKRKGFEAAFADPLFLTWPLARFVDALAALTEIFARNLSAYELDVGSATSDSADPPVPSVTEEGFGSVRCIWKSRKQEFLDICEVELTPFPGATV